MKKTLLHITMILLLTIMSSCRAVWDMAVMPFVEYDMEETDIKWSKYYPDCDYLSFKVDSSLRDVLLNDERFRTYRWKLKYDEPASPIQTIMFDKDKKCCGGYEFCYGNAEMLDVYDDVPIFKKNIYNDTIFEIIRFENYIELFVTDKEDKDEIVKSYHDYDYHIIVVWSYYGGYYMKRHLRQVRNYVRKFNEEYDFRVIYLEV